jgi:hypothetical protein
LIDGDDGVGVVRTPGARRQRDQAELAHALGPFPVWFVRRL